MLACPMKTLAPVKKKRKNSLQDFWCKNGGEKGRGVGRVYTGYKTYLPLLFLRMDSNLITMRIHAVHVHTYRMKIKAKPPPVECVVIAPGGFRRMIGGITWLARGSFQRAMVIIAATNIRCLTTCRYKFRCCNGPVALQLGIRPW